MSEEAVGRLTYRKMWDRYVEPSLKEQAAFRGEVPPVLDEAPRAVTMEDKIAEAQAAGLMFNQDPIEVAKAVRKSWPIKPGDIESLKAKLLARSKRTP